MARVNVPLADTVTVTGTGMSGDSAGYLVGSGAVWKDDSDATYASLPGQYFGPGEPQFFGMAKASIDQTVPEPLPLVKSVRVRIRLAFEYGSGVRMPRFVFRENWAAGLSADVTSSALCPASPTWAEVALPMSAAALESFQRDPRSWELQVRPHGYSEAEGVPEETQRIAIYEVYISALTAGVAAPPQRIFPREDGLGVGPRRHYPPPRSLQRSARRAGGYL